MSDYETAQRRRNIAVGIFVIGALTAIVWLIFKFGDLPVLAAKLKSFQVRVQFPTAPGVQENTPVRFCGYQIGRVTRIRPPEIMEDLNTHKFYHQTLVILGIDKQYDDIPADVEAKLMTRGLGSSYIELKLKHFDANEPAGPFLQQGSTLQGSTGMTSEFFPEESQERLAELVDGLRSFIVNANEILGDPNSRENFKTILANLSETTDRATKALEEFQKLSATGTATLKSADAKMEKAVVAAVNMSEELSETAKQLRLILEKVNNGEGSAARLLSDGQLYENLLESSEQMRELLEGLKMLIDEAQALPIKIK